MISPLSIPVLFETRRVSIFSLEEESVSICFQGGIQDPPGPPARSPQQHGCLRIYPTERGGLVILYLFYRFERSLNIYVLGIKTD